MLSALLLVAALCCLPLLGRGRLSEVQWQQLSGSSWPTARFGHALAGLPDGDLVSFGGHGGSLLDDVWRCLTATTMAWQQISTTTSRPLSRAHHTLVALADGTMVAYGGLN
eukprot:2314309-Amphidinium_carterae.1